MARASGNTWVEESFVRTHCHLHLFRVYTATFGAESAGGDFVREQRLARAAELLLEQGHDVVTEAGQATLVTVRWPGDTAAAAAQLYKRGVIIRELPGTGLLRASVGWWNDGSDLERLAEGLADVR